MNPAFVNIERPVTEGGVGTGKGGYWRVSEDVSGFWGDADGQKTTSHRGRAKKPRRSVRRFENGAEYQQGYFQYPYAQPQLHAPRPAPAHALQELAQRTPTTPHAPYQQDDEPKRSKKPAKRRKNEPAPLALPSPAMPTPSLPAATPLSAPAPEVSSPAAPATSLSASPAPAPTWSPLRPGYASYPGLTLQRAESFVRGRAESPPKLPTPPSERGGGERGAPSMGGPGGQNKGLGLGGMEVRMPSALEAFASTAIEEERYARRGLPSIAALLGPLSPESPGVTPRH